VSPTPARVIVRRRRRALAIVPTALAVWVGAANLPLSPAAAKAGTMHTKIITLSGRDALRTRSAAGSSTRDLRTPPTHATPGWSAALTVDAGTQAVGVSWTGAPTGEVDVRGHAAHGWTDWEPLAADPADGPDTSTGQNTRNAGGLAWFGRDGVDSVQVKVEHGSLGDLQVQSMRYEEPDTGSSIGLAPAGASAASASAAAATSTGATAAQPTIIPRTLYTSKGWAKTNSGCSSGPISASGGIKAAIVHHTVNANDYSQADVPAMLASIYAYHTGTQGWCDIAYNFIVDRFGRIWEGRSGGIDKPIVGGHAQGFNTGTVGVSFLGQYEPGASPTVGSPTSAALTAAGKLIGWKLGMYGIDPTGTVRFTSGGSNKYPAGTVVTLNEVSGHRDVGLTACPGQNLYDKLSTIRVVAKGAQNGSGGTTTTTTPTTTTTLPPATGPYAPFRSAWGLITQEYHDILRRSPSQDDIDFWAARIGNTWTPGQFVAHLASSSEADDKSGSVIRLYRAYFLRNPDHGGLTYWQGKRDAGMTLVKISSSFAHSSEFQRRYGSLSNAKFVDLVYQNVMGRAADSGGRSYWIGKLDSGTSRGQMMANFSQSSEYVTKTADGVHVVMVYEDLLRRAATADEYSWFLTGLRNASTSLTGVSNFVYDSDEYRARFP
jgi:hypothetical protein